MIKEIKSSFNKEGDTILENSERLNLMEEHPKKQGDLIEKLL